ncbi:MAG: hypothetical protein GY755_23055 [Chloroflexi bacterium]|nr:hypothetical protein [Chloroflexota bacterium]
MKKTLLFLAFLVFGITGCANTASPTPDFEITLEPTFVIEETSETEEIPPEYLPKSGDNELDRANAITNSIYLLYDGSDPAEVIMHIRGYLPTPCHQLRIYVPAPDEENIINVEIYALAEPDIDCEQVLRAFDISVNLGSYPAGSYWVWVNGGRVGNFDF